MQCPKCGNVLKPGAKFCGVCGTSAPAAPAAPETTGKEPITRAGIRVVPAGINKMPQGIALGDGEEVVRQYKIGQYTFRAGTIDVVITNKRVIRYEQSVWFGMQNNQIDEVNIDAVHGVSVTMKRSISILGAAIALFFLLGGIIGLASLGQSSRGGFGGNFFGIPSFLIGLVELVAGVIIALNSFRPSLYFYLHGAIGNQALETLVNSRGRLFGRNNVGAIFQFKPTAETTVMLREIGACIYDLKTMGDAAKAKWKRDR